MALTRCGDGDLDRAALQAGMGDSTRTGDWWDQPFRVFQTNLRETDAGLDVDEVLDAIEDFGADTWLLNAGGILAFHPSDLPFQTRNPYLAERASGDLLGDAVAAAHRRGVRVIARLDLSKVARPIADAHPEWCFIDTDGERQVFEGLVSVCPAGGYYQERSFDIIDEILDRYDVDGFFFNMFGFAEVDYSGRYRGVSQDQASRAAFAEFSGGLALPNGPDAEHYNLWRTWCDTVVADLGRRIREHIRRRRPAAALILRHEADILFDEANNEVGRELWHHQTSESVSALRTVHPDVPVMENCVSFIDMPYRLAGEEPEHFAQYLIQTIARGGNPSTYIMGVPGDIPYPSLELAAEVTRFHRRWSEVYCSLQPAASLGLVRPDPLTQSAQEHEQSQREFRGFYSALQERHLPFDVIPLGDLARVGDTGGLERYTDVLLPDVGALTAIVIAALDRYTAAGGRLYLTGRSAFTADGRAQLVDMPASAIRRTTSGKDLQSTYVAGADALEGRRVIGPIVPVHGQLHELDIVPGSVTGWQILEQAPYGPPEKAYGHRPGVRAGFARSPGGSTVIPWTIGAAYHDLGLTSIRDHALDLLVETRGQERVTVTAPEHVEVTLLRAAGRLVVHLINLSGRRRKTFASPSPIPGAQVRLRGAEAGTRVRGLDAEARMRMHRDGDDLVVDLAQIGRFEVLVFETDEGASA